MRDSLRLKVRLRPGTNADLIEQAERCVQQLAPEYERHAAQDLARLKAVFESLWQEPDSRGDAVPAMHKIAHDMKGQGTTFGYVLVTDVADSLCRYLKSVPPDRQSGDAIDRHLMALDAVLVGHLTGDGGEIGQSIRRLLGA